MVSYIQYYYFRNYSHESSYQFCRFYQKHYGSPAKNEILKTSRSHFKDFLKSVVVDTFLPSRRTVFIRFQKAYSYGHYICPLTITLLIAVATLLKLYDLSWRKFEAFSNIRQISIFFSLKWKRKVKLLLKQITQNWHLKIRSSC